MPQPAILELVTDEQAARLQIVSDNEMMLDQFAPVDELIHDLYPL